MRDNKLLISRKGGGGGGAAKANLPNSASDIDQEEEKSKFLIIKEELRQGLFGGFYVILRQSEQGAIWKFGLLYFVLLVQMLSFSFDESVSLAIFQSISRILTPVLFHS
jgi:hypothetical protein